MTRTVSISQYWSDWLDKIVSSGVRKSRAEIVEEGLKSINYTVNREADEWLDYKSVKAQPIQGEKEE